MTSPIFEIVIRPDLSDAQKIEALEKFSPLDFEAKNEQNANISILHAACLNCGVEFVGW